MKPTNLDLTAVTDMVTAVGLTDAEHNDLGSKMAAKGGEVYVNETPVGEIAKWMVDTLSDTEILFLAMQNFATMIEKATKGNCPCPACQARKNASKLPKELKDFLKDGGKRKKKGKKLDKMLSRMAKDGESLKFSGGVMKVVRKEDLEKEVSKKSVSLSDLLSTFGKVLRTESKGKFEEMLEEARAKRAGQTNKATFKAGDKTQSEEDLFPTKGTSDIKSDEGKEEPKIE
jgi:hypothetical protein